TDGHSRYARCRPPSRKGMDAATNHSPASVAAAPPATVKNGCQPATSRGSASSTQPALTDAMWCSSLMDGWRANACPRLVSVGPLSAGATKAEITSAVPQVDTTDLPAPPGEPDRVGPFAAAHGHCGTGQD